MRSQKRPSVSGGSGARGGVANYHPVCAAAACVNPLNGEGIDYGLETAQLAVSQLGTKDLTLAWPDQKMRSWVLAHSAALELYCGWPLRMLPDNALSATRSRIV